MGRSRKQPVMIRGVEHWTCSRCGANKKRREFSGSRRGPNGLRPDCDQCHRLKNRVATRNRMRRHRADNPERYRKIYREVSRLRDERSIKIRCRHALGRAVKSGRIMRPGKCSDCRKRCKPEAHHRDYWRPLVVEWLCSVCHGRRHWKS